MKEWPEVGFERWPSTLGSSTSAQDQDSTTGGDLEATESSDSGEAPEGRGSCGDTHHGS